MPPSTTPSKAADYNENTGNTRTYVITLDIPTGIHGIASAISPHFIGILATS